MRFAASVTAIVLCAAAAHAQDEAEARRLYARGTALARDEQRCGDAIEYFRRAIAIRETPQRVLSLGACMAATGQHVDAIATFTHYLELGGLSAAERAAARSALDDERRAVGTLSLVVRPGDAEVFIDGTARVGSGEQRSLLLDPGSHTVEVTAPGYETRRVETSALPGASEELSIELEQDLGASPRIAVSSERAEAEIAIDGQVMGRGSYEGDLALGAHVIVVRAPGFADFVEHVDAVLGETVRVRARLGASSSEGLESSPIFWTVLGAIVVSAAIAIAIGAWAAQPQVDAGNTGHIFEGLRFE